MRRSFLNVWVLGCVITVIGHASPPIWAQESGSEPDKVPSGMIYAFGVLIAGPYEFAGHGTDTFSVNGVLLRSRLTAASSGGEGVPEGQGLGERDVLLKEMSAIASKHESGVEREEAMMDFLGSCDSVGAYEFRDDGVWVQWVGASDRILVMYPSEKPKRAPATDEARDMVTERKIRHVVVDDGIYAYGNGDELLVPTRMVSRLLEQGKAPEGASLEEVPGWARLFVRDLRGTQGQGGMK